MTIKLAAFLICVPLEITLGQTVYPVQADSKGNQIVLSIANESKTTAANDIQVWVQSPSTSISFVQSAASVKNIPIGNESDVAFKFNVDREAKIGRNDTLVFVIGDCNGATWTKSIVVSYLGPLVYKLEQNFPNPFNPSTTIYYDLPLDSRVRITVYDILGREIRKLVDEQEPAGYQKTRFDIQGIASGVYIYRMQAEPLTGGKPFAAVHKMIVLK